MSIKYKLPIALSLCALTMVNARATEFGADTIGAGAEAFYTGALPPAGLYGLFYYRYYHASRFNDGNGASAVPGFGLTSNTFVPRLLYMSNATFLGGRLGAYAIGILPSAHLNVGGGSYHDTGIGDTIVGPVLAWGDGALRTALALDIALPTGSFNKNSPLNLGANYYSFRPILAITYLPTAQVEASAKITYTFSTINGDTDYRSGQLFHFDYSLSYAVTSSLRLGVNGYYIKQTTDDKQGGISVGPDGFRGQAFAIGPAVHYQWQKIGLELRVLKEYAVRNRPAGQQLWAKAVIPF